MKYSLRSRFRGALCGALVGESYGVYGQWQLRLGALRAHLHPCWGIAPQGWPLAQIYGLSLIQRGDVDPQDLGERLVAWREVGPVSDVKPSALRPETPVAQSFLDEVTAATITRLRAGLSWHKAGGTGTAACSLPGLARLVPVALFFHEDLSVLREKVYQTVVVTHNTLDAWYGALAVAHAIALAARGELQPETLLPRTLNYLQDETAALSTQLRQAQQLLEAGASLEAALLALPPTQEPHATIALAFYCFLSTPGDFALSVLRAVRCGEHAATLASLCGGLSGAYNGWTNIPVPWRVHYASEPVALADQLLAAWTGVYAPLSEVPVSMPVAAVAAPGILRPRPSRAS